MIDVLEAKKSVQGTTLIIEVRPIDSFDEAESILPDHLAADCRRLKDVCHLPETKTINKPKNVSLELITDLRGGSEYEQHLDARDKIPCACAPQYLLGLINEFYVEGIPRELYDYALIIAPQPVCRRGDSLYFMTAEINHGVIRLNKVQSMWLQGDVWVLAQGVFMSPYV